MDFTFSFMVSKPSNYGTIGLYSGTIRLPLHNNMVKLGRFCPDEILNKNFQHPVVEGWIHYETAEEFKKDCMDIVDRVNATISDLDVQDSFDDALIYVVENHIRRFGRIFVNDLMTYVDTYSELLFAIQYEKEYLLERCPVILFAMVEKYGDYVFEMFNTFDGRHIPFNTSPRYDNLMEHVAKIIRK